MTESFWFLLALWLCLILVGYIFRRPVISILGALFGVWVGLEVSSEGLFITLILILVNLYIGYDGLDNWDL